MQYDNYLISIENLFKPRKNPSQIWSKVFMVELYA